jgi:hypothetical protein
MPDERRNREAMVGLAEKIRRQSEKEGTPVGEKEAHAIAKRAAERAHERQGKEGQ